MCSHCICVCLCFSFFFRSLRQIMNAIRIFKANTLQPVWVREMNSKRTKCARMSRTLFVGSRRKRKMVLDDIKCQWRSHTERPLERCQFVGRSVCEWKLNAKEREKKNNRNFIEKKLIFFIFLFRFQTRTTHVQYYRYSAGVSSLNSLVRQLNYKSEKNEGKKNFGIPLKRPLN